MNIVAFDPGTQVIGISYLSGESGNKIEWAREVKIKGELVDRYKEILHVVDEAIQDLGEVEHCALESPYVGRNPSTAIKLGTVRGLIMSRVFTNLPNVKLIDIAPQEIRRVFNLPIKSKKEEYHVILKKHYTNGELDDLKEDGLDAVAVGLTAAAKIRKDLWWSQNA